MKHPIIRGFVGINGENVHLDPSDHYADDHAYVLAQPGLFADDVIALTLDVADYGAVGDGVADDAAAIQAALTAAAAAGANVSAKGTFKIGSTVTITSDADFSDATFNYSGGAGVAVQVGAGTTGTLLLRKTIILPSVVDTTKPAVGSGWSTGTVGVRVSNAYACMITAPHVKGFATGFNAYALGTGNVYNQYRINHMDNNKQNLVLGAGTGGWTNSNTFNLGLLTHESGEGTSVAGTADIVLETATNLVNGNLFVGGSVEGNVAAYHLDCDGLYNRFLEIRWENAGGCRVVWRASAARNLIDYGYAAQSLVETHTAGSSLNRVQSTGTARFTGSSASTVQWFENTSSSANATDTVMEPGATLAGSDPTTAYRVQRSADYTKMKRAADANPRIQLDHVNGRVYMGDGTAALTSYFNFDSAGLMKLTAATLYPAVHNTYDLGIAATRWRYVRLGTGVIVGTFTTATRPGHIAGLMVYDTTLNTPIWSDGTNWRNGIGTIV